MVASIQNNLSVVRGFVSGDIMLDSGSSVSLLRQDIVSQMGKVVKIFPQAQPKLVTASGDTLQVVDYVRALVNISKLEVSHDFAVVNELITSVILGVDFLQHHNLVLNFGTTPVSITSPAVSPQECNQAPVGIRNENSAVTAAMPLEENPPYFEALRPILQEENRNRARFCAAAIVSNTNDMVEDSLIPSFGGPVEYDFPTCNSDSYKALLEEYKTLFRTTPGEATGVYHSIPTSGSPAKVPPRRVPAHYREEVEKKIGEMLQQGIIEESNSPWMAPAVFVPKKSGEIRICIDYRELNKRTVKDAYPLPLADEVQDRLSNSSVFSTLDLQNGYWQLPLHPDDYEKTAFSPGPGMGLYHFKRMPFGLTGAPGSFQRLMDKIMRGLPFVSTFIDDLIVHSPDAETHLIHLRQVFQRLVDANLTLRGWKCRIALSQVPYTGNIFTGAGMMPDDSKVKAVQEWPRPTQVSEVC